MDIRGKVFCLFEQSAVFKKEFLALGIPAFDVDIENSFGETDYQVDLFQEIEEAYSVLHTHTHTHLREGPSSTN